MTTEAQRYHQRIELNVIRQTLPELTDEELSDLRNRFTSGDKLSDHRLRVCAYIASEYGRRGYGGRYAEVGKG
jgi:hypothetical protein